MINIKQSILNRFFPNLNRIEKILLGLILLTAILLRLWNPFHLPYIYDEFSALFRTQYDSLHDLVEHGIKPDNHPPLVQFFLFFWVKLWGFNPFWVKLPFIAMGVASVWLIFRLGQKWFSTETGLMASAYFATLQYSILYSQLARPYISGV
ncbi:MAG: glycosyltransferase family 39 protein, partial [Bacteroidota bacterium]